MTDASNKTKERLQGVFLVLLVGLAIFVFGYHCPFYNTLHIPCPGCGMSRALMALLQGDIALSLAWNAMLLPSAAAGILAACLYKKHRKAAMAIVWIWIAAMLGYWIWRLVFVFPTSSLF